jgi:peroxiredoxin Q/BCP
MTVLQAGGTPRAGSTPQAGATSEAGGTAGVPQAGQLAPELALPDEHGEIHRLADQRGRWTVIYFYPQDDTPGCTTEACQFRDLDDPIRQKGADVWGVSPDGAASPRRFREKFGLQFLLLSDEDHAVATRYGAWQLKKNYGREYMGIVRSSFLIDPDGRIARAWPRVKADGHAAEVLAALEEGRAARPEIPSAGGS